MQNLLANFHSADFFKWKLHFIRHCCQAVIANQNNNDDRENCLFGDLIWVERISFIPK